MTSHHDVAGVVAELRDPNAHYTSETDGDINLDRYIRWLLARCTTAADLLENQAKALSEAEQSKRGGFAFWKNIARIFSQRAKSERARALAAEARLAEAMKVIEPFAKAGELFGPRDPDGYDQCIG